MASASSMRSMRRSSCITPTRRRVPSVTSSSPNWQACGSGTYAGNAAPILRNTQSGTRDQGKLKIPNPYYRQALQPLFDTGGWYTPYDVIPSPFNAANGYEVPDVASLISELPARAVCSHAVAALRRRLELRFAARLARVRAAVVR